MICPVGAPEHWNQKTVALGQGLAQLHRTTGPWYGLDHNNFIGTTPQLNQPTDTWVTFFAEQRLGYQLELLGRNGYLPERRRRLLEKLLNHLGNWLPDHPPASLLHGDLWGGNWLTTTAGEPALD
jgi:fructosamine-3-kinase